MNEDKGLSHKKLLVLLILAFLPYLFTLPLDLIDIDTAQYAEISREMVRGNEYFQLRDNGRPYLDKPILTFWTISLFYKIFGISNFSFRLPAILALLISSFGIYKISLLRSANRSIALLSSLIYLTVPGTYIYTLNPTIDIYLNMYLILSVLMYYLGKTHSQYYFFWMFPFMGLGVVTKGPIGIVIPMIAIGGDILLRWDWKLLWRMHPFRGFLLFSIFPVFWSYLLFLEFDAFGPYFFLYLQSFGRLYMKLYDNGWNPGYFPATFLWMFATFSFFFLYYLYRILRFQYSKLFQEKFSYTKLHSLIKRKNDYTIEAWIFLFLFLISFSKFRLPQYTFWCIPAAAIWISPNLYSLLKKWNLKGNLSLVAPSFVFASLVLVIPFLVLENWFPFLLLPPLLLIIYFLIFGRMENQFALLFLPVVVLNLSVSLFVFPELSKYQVGKEMGKMIKEIEPDQKEVLSLGVSRSKRSFEFYSDRLMVFIFQKKELLNLLKESPRLAILPEDFEYLIRDFYKDDLEIETLKAFQFYKIETPKMSFLNKFTRKNVLKRVLLVRLKRKGE